MYQYATGILLANMLGRSGSGWHRLNVSGVTVWESSVVSKESTDYLFALKTRTDVRLVVELTRKAGHPSARVYSGTTPIDYRMVNGIVTVNAAPNVTMEDLRSGWMTAGKPNYDLKFMTHTQGVGLPTGLNDISRVQGTNGVPEWEISRLLGRLVPTSGYNRFNATVRMQGAPPFKTEKTSIPGFPYLSIGGRNVCSGLYVCTPSPMYFDVLTSTLAVNPVVGFENAGNYRINSLVYPNRVDFESPFAFYNFLANSRYAQLVVRAENYPAGDGFGFVPGEAPLPRMSFRYSWAGTNPELWSYSLDVAGEFSFHHTFHIGPIAIQGVGPNRLPSWVVHQSWPVETFVQAMRGYAGSEGIYFYTTQVGQTWPWLEGLATSPPAYLSEPALPANLSLSSADGPPVGFRGDYTANALTAPKLYVSPVDHLIHLIGAEGGIWNLGHHEFVREESLSGGQYLDAWILERTPKNAKTARRGHPIQSIYALPPYLIYMKGHAITVKKASESLSVFSISPPTNRASWMSFNRRVGPYQSGRNPQNMSAWLSAFRGATFELNGVALMSPPRIQGNRFSVVLRISRPLQLTAKPSGAPLVEVVGNTRHKATSILPGVYVLNYNQKTNWTIRAASLPKLSASIVSGPIHSLYANSVTATVINYGTSEWYGTLRLKTGSETAATDRTWIGAAHAKKIELRWIPSTAGRKTLSLRVDGRSLAQDRILVIPTPRGSVQSLGPLSVPKGRAIDGVVVSLIGLITLGGSVIAWRRFTAI